MADEIIVLTGIKETLDALKAFDKDAVKRFNKVINDELFAAQSSARGFVKQDPPLSGWRKTNAVNPTNVRGGKGWPGWDAGAIQAGIVKTKTQGKVRGDYTTSAGALKNNNAAGAIFEVAGRLGQSKSNSKSGVNFKKVLDDRFGKASRLIWRVVDKDKPRIEANVAQALNQAKTELQKHLNREQG
jgi:hypothetical protein